MKDTYWLYFCIAKIFFVTSCKHKGKYFWVIIVRGVKLGIWRLLKEQFSSLVNRFLKIRKKLQNSFLLFLKKYLKINTLSFTEHSIELKALKESTFDDLLFFLTGINDQGIKFFKYELQLSRENSAIWKF